MDVWLAWLILTLAWVNPFLPLWSFEGRLWKQWVKSSLTTLIPGALISGFLIYFLLLSTMWMIVVPIASLFALISAVLRINDDREDIKDRTPAGIIASISCLFSVIILLIAVLTLLFAGIFWADELYRTPDITMMPVGASTDKISIEHIRTVPKETAEWKADKKVGALGDKFETQEAHIQFRDGELKWLVPLEYGGLLWKAWVYREQGTEGYIKVSAENPYQEAERVSGLKMKYMPSGVFGYCLQRHIYWSYPDYYQEESVFQLNDEGNPIWVTMLTRPTVGYTGAKPEGIVVTDPRTGEMSFYDMQNIPPYIQRVMDERLTERYLTWWGAYIHGWWNSWLDQRDVKRPTGGVSIVVSQTGEIKVDEGSPDVYLIYGNDGKLYWFTSVTMAGKDLSMVGYTLTDVMNGKTVFYKTEGYFNDISAAKNVQQHEWVSKVMGFRVSQPIMYMIEGNETWIIPVLASTNEIRAFGVVHGKTGTTFVKEKLGDVLMEYQLWLTGKPVRQEEVKELSEEIIAKIIIQKDGLIQEIPVYKNSTITITTS